MYGYKASVRLVRVEGFEPSKYSPVLQTGPTLPRRRTRIDEQHRLFTGYNASVRLNLYAAGPRTQILSVDRSTLLSYKHIGRLGIHDVRLAGLAA